MLILYSAPSSDLCATATSRTVTICFSCFQHLSTNHTEAYVLQLDDYLTMVTVHGLERGRDNFVCVTATSICLALQLCQDANQD